MSRATFVCAILSLVVICSSCAEEDGPRPDTLDSDSTQDANTDDVPGADSTEDASADDADSTGCSADFECGMRGLICDAGVCIERICIDTPDCGQNRICFEGTCTPVECSRDDDCATDMTCVERVCRDGSTGTSCTIDDDCAQFGQVCNPITQMCVDDTPAGCTSDAQCTAPQRCHVPSGQCVAGCVQDTDCTDVADYCDATTGNCTTGCREGNCPTAQTCDLTTRECVGSCTISECAALEQACDPNTGMCADRTGKNLCEACAPGSDECGGPGDRCHSLGGSFVCTYACDSANGDADCPSGFVCQPLTSSASGCIPADNSCN